MIEGVRDGKGAYGKFPLPWDDSNGELKPIFESVKHVVTIFKR